MTAVVEGDFVRTVCVTCGAPLALPLIDEFTGERTEPGALAMKWANMVECDDCDDAWQSQKSARAGADATRKRIASSGIPPAFKSLSFDDMEGKAKRRETIDRAQVWAMAKDPRGLLVWGEAGAGKSRLAATALWERLHRSPCRWVSVMVLFAQLQAAFSDDQRKQALATLRGVDGLVLDDIDKIPLGENSRSHLLVAIDQRITHEVPLLITSNLAPPALKAHFGEAISSRVLGYCATYELPGLDRRMAMS